jgi:phage tail sheath protein FI
MQVLKTPGVYVQEVATRPPSVAEVSTAIPAFIGRTERGGDAARITSLLEYQALFGTVAPAKFRVEVPVDATAVLDPQRTADKNSTSLYYYLSHYFTNGGGPCWIFPLGAGDNPKQQFIAALARVEQEDEPTLILFPVAAEVLEMGDYGELAQAALAQCKKLKDRFTVLDVPGGDVAAFRTALGTQYLSYGAAYYPFVETTINWVTDDANVRVARSVGSNTVIFTRRFPEGDANGLDVTFTGDSSNSPKLRVDAGAGDVTFAADSNVLRVANGGDKSAADLVAAFAAFRDANPGTPFALAAAGNGSAKVAATNAGGLVLKPQVGTQNMSEVSLDSLKTSETALYNRVREAVARTRVTLPPSAAMAGIYAAVDRDRGVWKAPANVSLSGVVEASVKMTDEAQENLNVDPTAGKSINVIRDFTGRGTIVWGARTLAGNDNEWRYVPVRRLFINIEESAKKASAFSVFEPNDATLWLKVQGMIGSYLYGLWERGALAGSKPEQAYYVNVGLGKTMTAQDILEGRLIIEIGIAAVRPAEFVVLRFMHLLQQA